MKNKIIKRMLAYMLAATMLVTSVNVAGIGATMTVYAQEEAGIQVSTEYTFDSTNGWDTNNGKENNLSLTTDSVPGVGIKLEIDVLIPGENGPTFAGLVKRV